MLHLYVGSKRLSSWSLRPYLALAHAGLPFELTVIPLDAPTTAAQIAKVAPHQRVPVLHHGAAVIWDSLAICEYVAELAPAARLWPAEPLQRAKARSMSAEMHAGFAALRTHMPFALLEDRTGQGQVPEALADAARVQSMWAEQLTISGGPFLFGTFTIADAMFAPVASRFRTYGIPLDAVGAAYSAALFELPAMRAWMRDAEAERAG